MRSIGRMAVLAAIIITTACVPRPAPEPTPVPDQQPRPVPPPPVRTPPPPPPANWADGPLTPGTWILQAESGQALFGAASGAPQFVLRCDRPARQVSLVRSGGGTATALQLTTTYGTRQLPARAEIQPRAGLAATLPASDSLLDSIAFSRGRFMIAAQGLPTLIMPAWPELARVIEDCRI